jgi:L-aspartate oxidase
MAICDILIVGSGIAGLSLAIKLNSEFPDKKIYIVTKEDELESNTRYAQGGIAVVTDQINDSFQKHIEDTLRAGDGLCNKQVVEKVIQHAQNALLDLTENGVDLDRDENGNYVVGREGGHSRSRIVHYKDMTGFQVAVSLLVKVKTLPGIVLLSDHAAIDLITDRNLPSPNTDEITCYGAFILNKKQLTVEKYLSRVTILATGGVGQVYKTTTNPKVATGDGIAIAHRAGAAISNMEFIQFHPTAFYSDQTCSQSFLITEAIRGYGAFLRNCNGDRFMFKYNIQGELACRDVVARAIESEIRSTEHPCVYLDCTHLPADRLVADFPKIHSYCSEKGIDIAVDYIPVVPAAHYLCGGIDVDLSSRTSIKNLYALGECSHTGLHGANRLASNSLLEAVAFSEFCFQDIRKSIGSIAINSSALSIDHHFRIAAQMSIGLNVLKQKLQNLMTKHAGITRTNRGLMYALGYLELIDDRLELFYGGAISSQLLELRNLLISAKLIVIQSLNRKENRGTFYNTDLDIDYAFNSNKQGIYF